MSGLFSSIPGAAAKPLSDDEEGEGRLAGFAAALSDEGVRPASNDVRRLALLEGREDASEVADEPERRDDVFIGSDGHDTLIGACGKLDERLPRSIVLPPKPERTKVRSNDQAVSTSIPRNVPRNYPPAVPVMTGPGLRDFQQVILPEFERVMQTTAGHEGGLNKRDGTYKGLDQDALNNLVKDDPARWAAIRDMTSSEVKAIPSKDIPDDVRRGIYYWHYFSGPQLDLLAAIPGLAETEPQLAAQMFDSQVQHWNNGHGWLQISLNASGLAPDQLNPAEVKKIVDAEAARFGLPTTSMKAVEDSLVRGKDGTFKLKVDSSAGAVTRAVVQLALEAGKIHEVNDRIVDMRLAHLKSQAQAGNPGVWPRARRFRSNVPSPTYGPYGKSGIRPY